MTAALAILRWAWPYLLIMAIGSAAAWKLTKWADEHRYSRLQQEYSQYKLDVAKAEAASEKAYREALQAQIDDRHAADINNEQVMNALRQRTADAESHYAADREFIARMLNAASSHPGASRPQVPAADHQSGTAPAGETGGITAVADLCAATRAEDQSNADKLDSLLAELIPQLK